MRAFQRSFLLFYLVCCLDVALSWKIILLPFNTLSHVKMMVLTGSNFLKKGHEVWILTSIPMPHYDQAWGSINFIHIELPPIKGPITNVSCIGQARQSYHAFHHELNCLVVDHCRMILDDADTMKVLFGKGFDFAIVDGIHMFRCIHILPCYLGIPFFTLSIQHSPWIAGVPSLPSVEPHQLTGYSNSMAFHERFLNTMVFLASHFFFPFQRKEEALLFDKYCPRTKYMSIESLVGDAMLWFILSQPTCLDYPRRKAPHYIEINMPRPFYGSPISKDLALFVGTAPHGVVLVTYSCFTSEGLLPDHIAREFLQTFAHLPQRFVLKYPHRNNLKAGSTPGNVFIMDWLPQVELLAHPNTKLLIAHAGAFSMNEAIYHGVPVISIPFLADQSYNARRAMEHGWGFVLDKDHINSQTLREAILSVLNDSSCHSSALHCKNVLQSLPPGEESVYYWVEYVMKNGWKHLRPASSRQSIAAILMLDVVAVIILILLTIIYSNYVLLLRLARMWRMAKRKYPRVTFWLGPSMVFLFLVSSAPSIATHVL